VEKIARNCPDYRDLNNGEELIKEVVKVYVHGNVVYDVQFENYVNC
jgi:hypothetical protein